MTAASKKKMSVYVEIDLLSNRAGKTPRSPNAVKHANTTTNMILFAIVSIVFSSFVIA